MFLEKVRNFIVKLQNLSEEQRKSILVGIVVIVGIPLGILWLVSTAHTISSVSKNAKPISLPGVDVTSELDIFKNLGDDIQTQTQVKEDTLSLPADGWETYANSEYGFKVTYPPKYLLKEQAHKENYLLYASFQKTETREPDGLPIPYVSVNVYNQPALLETWLKENGLDTWSRDEDFWVDGQKAMYLTNPSDLGVAALVVISHGDKLFSLANFDSSSFKKFVSSFKFTN